MAGLLRRFQLIKQLTYVVTNLIQKNQNCAYDIVISNVIFYEFSFFETITKIKN